MTQTFTLCTHESWMERKMPRTGNFQAIQNLCLVSENPDTATPWKSHPSPSSYRSESLAVWSSRCGRTLRVTRTLTRTSVTTTMARPGRRSYRRLMSLPIFALYDEDDKLVATVRAEDKDEAESLFTANQLEGS